MNCAVTISAEDFKVIHNTLWELEYRGLDGRVGAERIRAALKGAYEQDSAAFDRKWDHYRTVREQQGFKTTWSLYEVESLTQLHDYGDAQYVVYDQHWGDSEVVKKIEGRDWLSLYRAADSAIRASGDDHHSFIEQFEPIADRPGHLRLYTGS
jgi:hypothetical protein